MKSLPLLLFALSLAIYSASAQSFNYETASAENNPELLGKINKDGLSTGVYSEWFLKNYQAYQPNTEVIHQFEAELKEYTITAFMGTWCGDSQREVPQFYEILDIAQFPLDRLTLVAVSRDKENYKQSPGGEEEGLSIHRVPTFIFYKNGNEINRIVESPVKSLEDDIDAILNGSYTPNYQAVTLLSKLLAEESLNTFDKKATKMLPALKAIVTKYSELNTYSNVLFTSGAQEEAIAVASLNTKLFPEESRAFLSLANKLYSTSNFSEAQKYYEKALALDSDNKQLQESIASFKKSTSN